MKTKTVKRPPAKPKLRNRKGSAPDSDPLKRSTRSGPFRAQEAGRAARPAAPGAGGFPGKPLWQLRLYVMDQTARSVTALANLKQLCETHLQGRYRITVIDLVKQPHLAKGDQILAIPTVVRKLPRPVRTLIGTLADTEHSLLGLDLRAAN
jgi:circadian clock protein KaiB